MATCASRAAEKYPDAAMFGSLQLDAADPNIFDGAGDCYSCFGTSWRGGYGHPVRPLPDFAETFSPCAAAAMYRTDWFARVGGFNATFFCYIEDVDLGFRVRLLGGRCLQVNNAVVHHVGSATAETDSEFSIYHGTRNRFWTVVKNCPRLLLCVIRAAPACAYLFFNFPHEASASAPAIKRGLRDGIADLRHVWRQRAEIQASRTASTIDRAVIDWSISDFRSPARSVYALGKAVRRTPSPQQPLLRVEYYVGDTVGVGQRLAHE